MSHNQKYELEQCPHIKQNIIKAINNLITDNPEKYKSFKNAEDMYNWWLSQKSIKNYIADKGQINFLDKEE